MSEPAHADLGVIDERLLPPQLRTLVKLIGVAETLRLLAARGGVPTYIAQDPEQSALREFLQRESVEILCGHFGREVIDLPKADKLLAQIRNHYIREARRHGTKSGRQLARELGLSWRMIKIICAEGREEDPTGDLFEVEPLRGNVT